MDRLSLLVRAKISIHASAKEATFHSLKWRINTTDFNPRLREGGDNGWLYIQTLQRNFNPRLREGGDKEYHRNNGGKKNFNPRLREGGDGIQRHNRLEESKISIHASAKEATIFIKTVFDPIEFQSTPPRRRRPQHIVIPQLSCTYLVSTTFLSTFFSFISQYVVLFFLF